MECSDKIHGCARVQSIKYGQQLDIETAFMRTTRDDCWIIELEEKDFRGVYVLFIAICILFCPSLCSFLSHSSLFRLYLARSVDVAARSGIWLHGEQPGLVPTSPKLAVPR
jgi:hypothetical protein